MNTIQYAVHAASYAHPGWMNAKLFYENSENRQNCVCCAIDKTKKVYAQMQRNANTVHGLHICGQVLGLRPSYLAKSSEMTLVLNEVSI